MDAIRVGLEATAAITVDDRLLADAMGSGSVAVLATPAMVALMEAAAVDALEPVMSEGQSSVGIALDIRHLAATPPGRRVRARARVIEVQGKKVTFQVEAWDESELIGSGTHSRYIIDIARFMEHVNAK